MAKSVFESAKAISDRRPHLSNKSVCTIDAQIQNHPIMSVSAAVSITTFPTVVSFPERSFFKVPGSSPKPSCGPSLIWVSLPLLGSGRGSFDKIGRGSPFAESADRKMAIKRHFSFVGRR